MPYAAAVGQVALAWNSLHESLGSLFMSVMSIENSGPSLGAASLNIWSSVSNDRQKRVILEAAVSVLSPEKQKELPHIKADVAWLVKRSTALEDKRNDALHSPFHMVHHYIPDAELPPRYPRHGSIVPTGFGRGAKLHAATILKGRPVLKELRLYRDYATTLSVFALALGRELFRPTGSWPERPRLPPL
jgi:hypothetical protein